MINNNYFGGFIAGLSISPGCYIFDLLKIKKQIPSTFCKKMPGLYATFVRESLAFGMWFGSYFDLTKSYKFSPFIAGGLSGVLAWTISYPIDVIKNRQMAQNKSFLDSTPLSNNYLKINFNNNNNNNKNYIKINIYNDNK